MRRILREERVPITGGIGLNQRGVQFRLTNRADADKIIGEKSGSRGQVTGNTLSGAGGGSGVEVTVSPEGLVQAGVTEVGSLDKVRRAVDQSIEVLRRRIDSLGTTEPNIQREGNSRILVQVPGLQDPERLKEILGTTAKLEFRLAAEPGANPADIETMPQTEGGTIQVEKQIMVQGEDLTDAQPGFDSRSNEPIVNFRFQHPRRPEIWRGDVEERRTAVRHRAR